MDILWPNRQTANPHTLSRGSMTDTASFYRRHIAVIYLVGGLVLGAEPGYTAPRTADPKSTIESGEQRRV